MKYSSYTVRDINVIPEKRVVRNKFNIYVFIMSLHSPVNKNDAFVQNFIHMRNILPIQCSVNIFYKIRQIEPAYVYFVFG
jgi:hypothetical protein